MTSAPYSLFLLLSLGVAQTVSPAPPTEPGMTAVRNDALRLSYRVPANFVDATALVGPALQASLSGSALEGDAARCISLPLARMAAGGAQGGLAMVLLVRADGVCFKKRFDAKSVAELTEGEVKGVTASGAKAQFGEVRSFTVAGRPASALDGSFALPTGQRMQARVVCVLDQPDIACWQFLAGSTAEVSTLSGFPVSFDGSASTPLTPPAP